MSRTHKEKVKGLLLKHAPRFVSRYYRRGGEFDKTELLKLLPPEPVILDIGASNGRESVEFRMLFPKAIIHCFEPEPSNFQKLLGKTEGLGIQCHQIALGSTNAKQKFFVSSGPSGASSSSLKKPTQHMKVHPQIKFKKVIEVDTVRLEDWLSRNTVHHVDFLWMDTQGTELDILKNSGTVLQSVKAIHIEVSLMQLYEEAPLYQEVREFLEHRGLVVLEEILHHKDMGNVVFIKKAK